MNKLPTIYDHVKKLLEGDVKYRNSDIQLYLRILHDYGCMVYSTKMSEYFISVNKFKKAPNSETVRRARQHIQNDHPELIATDPFVLKKRGQREKTKGNWVYQQASLLDEEGLRA